LVQLASHFLVPLAAIVAFASSLVLLLARATNSSSGALDNAAGVGVLLELGRSISSNPCPCTEVSLVAPGAEELGLLGSTAFCRRHLLELTTQHKNVMVINLDGTGAGKSVWISGGNCKDGLSEMLRSAANAEGIQATGPFRALGLIADHMPFRAAGISALTLSGLLRKLLSIHTRKDRKELLEAETMDLVGRLVLRFLGDLERTPVNL
jgi:Zn-dependent M28 family amino/carboxypeptidase